MRGSAIIYVLLIVAIFSGVALKYRMNLERLKTSRITVIVDGKSNRYDSIIAGMRDTLKKNGFAEDVNLRYKVVDLEFKKNDFDKVFRNLLSSDTSDVVVSIGPFVSKEMGRRGSKKSSIVFVAEDLEQGDPIEDIISQSKYVDGFIVRQNMKSLVKFAKLLIPKLAKVGVLIFETKDGIGVREFDRIKDIALPIGVDIVGLYIDSNGKYNKELGGIDILYLGSPYVPQEHRSLVWEYIKNIDHKIPIISDDASEAITHKVLASFGAHYYEIGNSVGKICSDILKDVEYKNSVKIIKTPENNYIAYVSKKQSQKYKDYGAQYLPKDVVIVN